MKQTNNAIKFLMAQYRAIFKSAYIKGLATAVVLTSALAVGQAQAASTTDPWYSTTTSDDSQWNKIPSSANTTNTSKRVTGGYDTGILSSDGSADGVLSGSGLVIGAQGDDDTDVVTLDDGKAYGGYVSIALGSSLNAHAERNVLTVKSGGTVNNSGSNLVGGWAKTLGTGTAKANNNEVNINEGAILTSAGQTIGGWASSNDGATANDNIVTIKGSDTSKISFAGANGIFGAHAYVESTATGGKYIAQGNHVDVQNADLTNDSADSGSSSGKWIIGGYAYTNNGQSANSGQGNAEELAAIGNKIDITGVTVGSGSTTANKKSGFIVANLAANNLSGSVATVRADGSADSYLKISDSTLNHTEVFGGKATNIKGGTVSASNNIVEITNTDIGTNSEDITVKSGSAVYGGLAETTTTKKDAEKGSVTASNNSVTITGGETANTVNADIYGGFAKISSDDAASMSGSSLTADNNTVTIGENITVSGSVLGAYLAAPDDNAGYLTDGTMSASNNTIILNGTFNAKDGNISAVTAEGRANLTGNKVVINGKVNGVTSIFGAFTGKDDDASVNDGYSKLSGNSITINADAEVTADNIIAAYSQGSGSLALNNDVTVAGKVTDSSIFGGAGADSVITLAAGSVLKYNAQQAGTNQEHLGSDVVDIAGTIDVGANNDLQIHGYYFNGKSGNSFNTNTTKIAETAAIYNKGTITFLGDTTVAEGASLHALSTGALLKVDGTTNIQSTVTPSSDMPVEMVGGKGALTLSTQTLKSYLASGDDVSAYVGSPATDAQGAVQVTSGGTLGFSDKVTLSDFAFDTAATAGKIQVDTGAIAAANGSIFRADDMVVAHAFVKDNTKTGDDLLANTNVIKDTDAQGIVLQAKNLTLGSSSLVDTTNGTTKTQTSDIDFGAAVVTDSINFVSAQDENGHASMYVLDDSLYFDNATAVKNDKGEPLYHLPGKAVKTGDVKLTGTSGSFNVLNGNVVASDAVVLADDGSIKIGKAAVKPAIGAHNNPLDSDATLVLEDGLTIDIGSSSASGAVTVTGNAGVEYDFEQDAENVAELGMSKHRDLAQLDLRQGINVANNNKGEATIKATDGGVILLNGSNFSNVLAGNGNNGTVKFNGATGGKFIAEGAVEADFSDFGNTKAIDLSSDSVLQADSITLSHTGTTAKDADYIKGTENEIALGGIVRAADVVIEDRTQVTDAAAGAPNNYASQVEITSGTLEISKSLSAVNNKVVLGVEGGDTASIELETLAAEDKGTIAINKLDIVNGDLSVNNGSWDAAQTTLTLGKAGSLRVGVDPRYADDDINDHATVASLNVNSLKTSTGSDIYVGSDGSLTVQTADLSGLSKLANSNAAMVINGDVHIEGKTGLTEGGDISKDMAAQNGLVFGKEGSIQIQNSGRLSLGNAATTGAVLAEGSYTGSTVDLNSKYTKIDIQGGELVLGFTDQTTFGKDALLDLKKKLFLSTNYNADTILVKGGVLNIGNANFEGFTPNDDGDGTYTIEWKDIKSWSDITSEQLADVTNNKMLRTDVINVADGEEFRGHFGSITMTGSQASTAGVIIAGDTSLRFAEGNNGFFISNSNDTAAANARISSGKSLTLVDGGAIGTVTLENGIGDNTDDDLTILRTQGNGEFTITAVKGGAASSNGSFSTFEVNAKTTVKQDITNIGSVEVNAAELNAQDISVSNLEVYGGKSIAKTGTLNKISVEGGSADFQEKLTLKLTNDESYIYNNGTLTAAELVMSDGIALGNTASGVLNIGVDEDLFNQDQTAAGLTGTGYMQVGTLDMNQGTLFVDPNYGSATSLAAIKTFKDTASSTVSTADLGLADGNIAVGKNAAVGIGTDLTGLKKAIANYQTNGSLDAKKYGSILYVNGQLELGNGNYIALDGDATAKTLGDVIDVRHYTENSIVYNADMGLGEASALILTDTAFTGKDGTKTETAIHFNKTGAVVNNQGGEIVLQGSFNTSEKLNVFGDNDTDGKNGIKLVGSDLKIVTENGFLFGVINVGDNVGRDVSMEVDTDRAYNIMSEASNPVVESMIAYGNRGVVSTDKPEDTTPPADGTTKAADTTADSSVAWTEVKPAETAQPETPVTGIKGGSDFLDQVITTTNGAPAEQAARLAVYGGAAQAALSAISTSSDAVAARMGTGTDAGLTVANNGMGGALWLAPVYRNQDSDGFAAQGLEYGVDLNLYGLALGGDYTINNAITVGAMFNLGSGDADGQGNTAAAGVSNDFDYYGFSIYGGYRMGALNLSADFGFTSVDSDIEANNSLARLTTSADSKVWTLGVTGKYAMTFNGVEVAPHAGLRFTSIDLDDYTIKADGADVAAYDADKLNVFSIPVGVTIAREFEGETWTVKPSFDLTLTGQFGDDEAEGTVSWSGVDGLKTNVSSEVFDNFTYGATVGVAAQTGNFSLGFGLNYTGSSNVDEFGVNANARYVF